MTIKTDTSRQTQMILDEFQCLAKVPRPSHHEERISKYLYEWAQTNGLMVEKDIANNIIIEKKASKGCEDVPLTLLQAHMDMVCVANEGYPYDPINDPIIVVEKDDTLTAYQTSLGADDGIGVAMAQYILKNDFTHGPLRVLFTTNEEDGMGGASAIDAKYLSDAAFLINLDAEDADTTYHSSAGSVSFDYLRTPTPTEPQNSKAITIYSKGLNGGHSGITINDGNLNAIRVVAGILLALDQNEIAYELSELNGGRARNAISADCTATIVLHESDSEKLSEIVKKTAELCKKTYIKETTIKIGFEDAALPETVLAPEDKNAVVYSLGLVLNGVHTMSQAVEGLVESSSNLGMVQVNPQSIRLCVFARSSEELFLEQIKGMGIGLGKLCGLTVSDMDVAPAWPVNTKSTLLPLIQKVYLEQNKESIKALAVHAGLECSYFAQKCPALDIVSVGPNLKGVHSPAETLWISSIDTTANLVIETLKQLTLSRNKSPK